MRLNGKNEASINHNYKKHLKKSVLKKLSGTSFTKIKNPSKPDHLVNDSSTSEIFDTSTIACTADNMTRYGKSLKVPAAKRK